MKWQTSLLDLIERVCNHRLWKTSYAFTQGNFKFHGIRRTRYLNNHGHRQGEHMERPEIERNCCRKMMLFPKALYLAITRPEVIRHSIIRLNFYQNFLKISQQFIYFAQTCKKLTRVLKFYSHKAKRMHFCYFLKKFCHEFHKQLCFSWKRAKIFAIF